MGTLVMLVDFGSTFTKVLLVDVVKEEIVARAISPSTVETGITKGLNSALEKIDQWDEFRKRVRLKLACSSAAGGLRIIAIGLVPELTGEAARQAALGAGARIIRVFSHKLTAADIAQLEENRPDILLLSGGTDGGERGTVEHNGVRLADSRLSCPIVVACNREAAPIVTRSLRKAGKVVVETENVMPDLGRLNVEPAKREIRRLFIKHIVRAKGLEKARKFVDVLMPTPSASLRGSELLAEGTAKEEGLGDLMVVEVGGATTNVYSIFTEPKSKLNVVHKGIEEARMKRTVEGDLGVRVSAPSLVQAAGSENIAKLIGTRLGLDALATAERLTLDTSQLPDTEQDRAFDAAITRMAVRHAVARHVGRIEEVHTPAGTYFFQTGKNFETLGVLIGSGGPVVHSPNPAQVIEEGIAGNEDPAILKPKKPRKLIDGDYVLWSMGLLSAHYPDAALRMLKRSLRPV